MNRELKMIQQPQDGMPYEVATAFLTFPKAKLSATFRRECQRAREIVWTPVQDDKIDAEPARFNRKLASKTLLQVCKLRKRTQHRRNRTYRAFSAMKNLIDYAKEPVPDNAPIRAFCAQAEAQLVGFDFILEACENDLKRRKTKPVQPNATQETKLEETKG